MADSLKSLLQKDWQRIAESVVKKRGRKLEDLRFARRTSTAYAFFLDKETPWDMLHEIAEEVGKLFPHIEFATVAEVCSEFFNSTGEDLIAA